MDTLGSTYLIAQELFARLGRDGADIIEFRARAHKEEGDADAARFWTRVAQMMRELDPPSEAAGAKDPGYVRIILH